MPTRLSPDEIRILDLPPASGEEDSHSPLECTTRAIKLSDDTEYEALSYVWGTDQETAIVRISGQDVQVSRTLEKALRRLQLPHRARALWIDQLCIDQANSTEKMQQVRHMGAIYEGCTQCIAWMGEVRDDIALADADAAIQLLHYMVALSEADDPDGLPLPEPLTDAIPEANRALKSISRLENAWWKRIWTVQEAVLPADLTFQWGPFTLPWATLLDATQTLCSSESRTAFAVDAAYDDAWGALIADTCWVHNAKIRDDATFHMSTPLQLIHRWRWREATDPLDKVYGVLGLFDKGSLPRTERCDYELDPARVYATLTQELILDEKGLRPLTVSPRVEAARATPGIPSWALDLAAPDGPAARPATFALVYGYWSYQADSGMGPMDLDIIQTQLGQDRLTLTGALIDTITAVGERQENENDLRHLLMIEETLRGWYQFAVLDQQEDVAAALGSLQINDSTPETKLYPGGLYDKTEAFARLALGDVIRDGQQVPVRAANDEDIRNVNEFLQRVEEDEEDAGLDGPTRDTVRDVLLNQRVFATAKGLLGCGHLDTQAGDQVWVFRGGRVPFVVRPRDGSGKEDSGYTLVGECYVQGIMQGEGVRGEVFEGDKPTEREIGLY